MGASRKLQGEIDRVLKKVQEGVDVFDSIWNKVYDTDNANQKEKFEADLKKEIKKLQRYRDQIKTWIQSSEIKDKKVSASYEQALMDARKLIEREMERFKICEKETKTKAFSKEGLGQQPKTDPKEKAKSETRDWLNNVVSELESQIDSFEAEIEGLTVKKGKTRPPRLEDFDEFGDVDGLYKELGLDKVDALEELVAIVPPALVKGVGGASLNLKSTLPASPTEIPASVNPTISVGDSGHHQTEELASPTSTVDNIKSPPPKSNIVSSSVPTTPVGGPTTPVAASLAGVSGAPASLPSSAVSRGVIENANPALSMPSVNLSSSFKEEDITSIPGRRPSPAFSDVGLARGVARGGLSSQPVSSVPFSSGVALPSNGALVGVSSDATKRVVGVDDRITSSGLVQSLVSPSSSRIMLPHALKANDGTVPADTIVPGEAAILPGRSFSPSGVPGIQWRPGNSFPNQNEGGQVRARAEIAPDQREKFLQKLQQVQQHGHSNLLGMPSITGGNLKQFSASQPNPLLQQFNAQSPSVQSQIGLGLGSLGTATSAALQQSNISYQQSILPNASKEVDSPPSKIDDIQQQQPPEENADPDLSSAKSTMKEDDQKTSYSMDSSIGVSEPIQTSRDTDLSLGQPLQSNQSSANHGVIGRRSAADLGTIGDNLSGLSSGGVHDHMFNLQMLEAAYTKLPQPKDSERSRSYIPKHPAATPASYPQAQAPILNNPAFWERYGVDNIGTDTLFFAFYFQQNTYQQYLAAKELKKQSWRYHRKYNTWFQRHEEPKVATDEYEQGTYVYFDFHIADDNPQSGWCQRIKHEFTFEYNYLEDELS
uniref:CCR4-NOT transcription complex subunit 3 n=1 Tax=Kalanchoe fedtschenkoi TaxID=63787 RepID=A0A7N1A6K0_KALFE